MTISEKDRLDLRQALARSLGSEHLANVAMEAMPPIDYSQLATKTDLEVQSRELRAEIAQLRAEMAELRGDLKLDLASNLRLLLIGQLTTMVMLGAWITAVT